MPHLTLHPTENRIDVRTEWSEKELIRQVPGARWDTTRKTWHVSRSWAAAVQLRAVFGSRLTLDDHVRAWATEEKKRVDAAFNLRDRLDVDADAALEVDARLFAYQQADVAWLVEAGSGALLGNSMGTGKTIALLSLTRHLTAVGKDPFPALVICPNSVKRNWEAEATVWCPEATPYVISGGAGQRQKQLKAAAEDPTALVIINYEALRLHSRLAGYGSVRLVRCPDCGGDDERVTATRCEAHPKELNTFGFKTIIIDEGHRLKEPKSKQTRATWAVCHGPIVERRIALTGTPLANHVGDLWAIGHAIAPEEYPVRSSWMDRYALLSWNAWGGLDVVGIRPDTKDELFRFLDPRFRRITKERVLDQLPPKVRSVRHAPLIPKMRKAYVELEEQLVTRLDTGEILFSPNQLAATLRLLQLSSSYGAVLDDGSYRLTEPSPKLDVLDEILEEVEGRPIAVCALSKQLINLAATRLASRGIRFGLITGDVNEVDRRRALDDFQAGRLAVLLFTIQAGGVGLTMTAADTIVFLQRSWSLLDNRQAEDRVHRIGSEVHDAIHVIDIVAPDTVEERQIARLHEKLRRLEELTRDGQEPDLAELGGDDLRGEEL